MTGMQPRGGIRNLRITGCYRCIPVVVRDDSDGPRTVEDAGSDIGIETPVHTKLPAVGSIGNFSLLAPAAGGPVPPVCGMQVSSQSQLAACSGGNRIDRASSQ